MMIVFLWTIVGAGLVGLVAVGMAARAWVQAVREMNRRLDRFSAEPPRGGVQANLVDARELERLEMKLAAERNNSKTLLDLSEKMKTTHETEKQKALAEQEAAIRKEYEELEARKKELEAEVCGLKAEHAASAAVKASIEAIAPYVYSYGNWYHGKEKAQNEGGATSAIWRFCKVNQEMRECMLNVFRYAATENWKQVYVEMAKLYETAYRQTQEPAALAEVKDDMAQMLKSLEAGRMPLFGLQWPETGACWDEKTAKRQEENGQSTILAVVRPVVMDLKTRTVFSRGIVKTGG